MPSYTITAIIAQALAQSPEQLKLFSQCQWKVKDNNLIIDCPSEKLLEEVRSHPDSITRIASRMEVDRVLMAVRGIIVNPFETPLLVKFVERYRRSNIPKVSLHDERAIAIIRMADHRGVFCSDALGQLDKVNPNDYVGDNIAAKYNIPEVFDRYMRDLYQHRFLDNYEMDVLDGLGNKKHQVVRVWLSDFRGEECRIVQVLDDRY